MTPPVSARAEEAEPKANALPPAPAPAAAASAQHTGLVGRPTINMCLSVPAEKEAEMDEVFKGHEAWMRTQHKLGADGDAVVVLLEAEFLLCCEDGIEPDLRRARAAARRGRRALQSHRRLHVLPARKPAGCRRSRTPTRGVPTLPTRQTRHPLTRRMHASPLPFLPDGQHLWFQRVKSDDCVRLPMRVVCK